MLRTPAITMPVTGTPRGDNRANGTREQAVVGDRHGQLADDQNPAIQRAERRNGGADTDEQAERAAAHRPGGVGKRRGGLAPGASGATRLIAPAVETT